MVISDDWMKYSVMSLANFSLDNQLKDGMIPVMNNLHYKDRFFFNIIIFNG